MCLQLRNFSWIYFMTLLPNAKYPLNLKFISWLAIHIHRISEIPECLLKLELNVQKLCGRHDCCVCSARLHFSHLQWVKWFSSDWFPIPPSMVYRGFVKKQENSALSVTLQKGESIIRNLSCIRVRVCGHMKWGM